MSDCWSWHGRSGCPVSVGLGTDIRGDSSNCQLVIDASINESNLKIVIDCASNLARIWIGSFYPHVDSFTVPSSTEVRSEQNIKGCSSCSIIYDIRVICSLVSCRLRVVVYPDFGSTVPYFKRVCCIRRATRNRLGH